MRILMLSQAYPPIIGGEAQHVRTLSVELVSRGHDVAVVTLWYEGQAELEEDQGVRVYRIRCSTARIPWLFSHPERRRAPTFPDPEIVLALRRIIKKERPEIVHAHNWLVYSFLPLKAWSGARLVVTLHNYNLACAKVTLLRHDTLCEGPSFMKCLGCAAQFYGPARGVPIFLSNWVMSKAERGLVDMFLPNSQATAIGNGLVGGWLPFRVIPHFIPDDAGLQQGDAEPYLSQLPAGDYLLFVGGLGYLKGVDVLLRAYAGLTNAPPLVLIGYPVPNWSIESVARPANVFVFQNWPRYAVMEAWRRSMLGLVPSIWPEPFGLVALEAMSAGRPVIASRTGGLIDIVVDGETGLLVQPRNPLALQQAIERLLADPDLRSRMGQAGMRKFREFQVSTLVPRFVQAYEDVLQQKAESSQRVGLMT
ncbi:MAG TPA: glycosyltransferase family 4 protein [Ktedonobacteraceae bacterium]|jgi:glycosyltransferase involved in cell wall biosynthesis|nr:glycosyltransferase family 4 protein [Ktedonobacteraceae bacterium]